MRSKVAAWLGYRVGYNNKEALVVETFEMRGWRGGAGGRSLQAPPPPRLSSPTMNGAGRMRTGRIFGSGHLGIVFLGLYRACKIRNIKKIRDTPRNITMVGKNWFWGLGSAGHLRRLAVPRAALKGQGQHPPLRAASPRLSHRTCVIRDTRIAERFSAVIKANLFQGCSPTRN